VIVNWTERALNSLGGIYDYISHDAPVYAQHFAQQIMSSVDRLEQHPLSGRRVVESERDDIREIIFQRYRIIYWVVSDDQIDIVGVVHGARDINNPRNQPWEDN
jgi:toxin ParE1/3/4